MVFPEKGMYTFKAAQAQDGAVRVLYTDGGVEHAMTIDSSQDCRVGRDGFAARNTAGEYIKGRVMTETQVIQMAGCMSGRHHD